MAKKKKDVVIKKDVIVKEHELDTTELSSPPKDTSDIDYWGEKMVKLQDRINELELSMSDINTKLKQVSGRLGL